MDLLTYGILKKEIEENKIPEEQINQIVTGYMNEHPPIVEVDSTLKVEGKAADAAAAGKAIDELKGDLENLEQETINIFDCKNTSEINNAYINKLQNNGILENIVTDTRSIFNAYVSVVADTSIKLVYFLNLSTGHYVYHFKTNTNAKRILFKHSGSSEDIGFYYNYIFEDNTDYVFSFDVVDNRPNIVGGLVVDNFQITKGTFEYSFIKNGSYTASDKNLQSFIDKNIKYGKFSYLLKAINISEKFIVPEMFGAIGDGVTDDTEAIQKAIDSSDSGIFFLNKTYKHGTIFVANKTNFSVIGNGSTHILDGTGAVCFKPTGTVKNVTIDGCNIIGNGNIADAHCGIANDSGVIIENLKISNNTIDNTTIGISVNANYSGSIKGCIITKNLVRNIKGEDPGAGYGIHVADGMDEYMGVIIENNTIDSCQRHSIYCGRGRGVIIKNNIVKNHRTTVTERVARSAMEITRSSNVLVDGNYIANFEDCGILIIPEEHAEGLPMDSYPSKNIIITNNIFENNRTNLIQTISVGYVNSSSGIPENISIVNNKFITRGYIEIVCGKYVQIFGNSFESKNNLDLYQHHCTFWQ